MQMHDNPFLRQFRYKLRIAVIYEVKDVEIMNLLLKPDLVIMESINQAIGVPKKRAIFTAG